MKKKTTSNPLKTFNDNKAKAYMKAGGTMKSFKKSLPKAQYGEQTPFQKMRRNILTKRINNLDNKGIESQVAGNKEKAFRQFDKSDRLLEKRAKLREKAGYMKGGVVKKKKK
jgi:glutamine synthetase